MLGETTRWNGAAIERSVLADRGRFGAVETGNDDDDGGGEGDGDGDGGGDGSGMERKWAALADHARLEKGES
ncbi:hypothetical protein E4U54_006132 [Claviceps lovelessii]|nr:hypothetical protein E4U54_006132 [Claviceps lovelessii]